MDDLSTLALNFEQAAGLAPRRLGAVLGNAADRIRDEARRNVSNNLSPRFAKGIVSRREKRGNPPAAYILTTDDRLGEAIRAWEVGTARHGPRPSIAPAVERQVKSIEGELAELVEKL